jgi:eukaryotic-like serine/threonine-protein kinase
MVPKLGCKRPAVRAFALVPHGVQSADVPACAMTDFAPSSHAPLQPAPGVAAAPGARPAAVRRLGRFELRSLVGRSAHSMAWRVGDPRTGQELLLVMPRRQPPDPAALQAWLDNARRAARLTHPHLGHVVEVGEQERWPYVAYDGADAVTLAEHAAARSARRDTDAPADVARCIAQAAAGLAFAHDAGHAHRDVQPWLITLSETGSVRVLGLEVAPPSAVPVTDWKDDATVGGTERQALRGAAERDVLALSVVMHALLSGTPPLDEPDVAVVLSRMAPTGREPVRLAWDLPRPVPDVLRAIANRATDRQPRQRYRNARTLVRALEGFLEADAQQGADAHAQLVDRVRQIGVLPALPGAAARAARLALMEREHTEELAQVVLRDPALSFELLRTVNSAQHSVESQASLLAGSGPVLTVRRAVAMLGLDGVRRCALALRDWPGPLDATSAQDLMQAVTLAQRAGRLSQLLRPAGYDGEMVSLVTLLQNLGRLLVQYHYPDEIRQVRRLMLPAPGVRDGDADQPGLDEQTASFAVLGADIESMGAAVARWWGLDESVLHMIRRLPTGVPVRSVDTDDDMLRTVASAANEAMDALALPVARQASALERVALRYARTLGLTLRDLVAAVQASATAATAAAALAEAPAPQAQAQAQAEVDVQPQARTLDSSPGAADPA